MAEELLVVGRFVENDLIMDGIVLAMDGDKLLWCGPTKFCPLDQFPVGTLLHVHPALYARIACNVAKVEDGTPDLQSPV